MVTMTGSGDVEITLIVKSNVDREYFERRKISTPRYFAVWGWSRSLIDSRIMGHGGP